MCRDGLKKVSGKTAARKEGVEDQGGGTAFIRKNSQPPKLRANHPEKQKKCGRHKKIPGELPTTRRKREERGNKGQKYSPVKGGWEKGTM